MDHRIPKVGVAISVMLAVLALITFVFLNGRFQGPNPAGFLQNPYELSAKFKDNKTIPTKQSVLYHGIDVGTVTGVTWDKEKRESTVKFVIDDGFKMYKGAAIRIGAKSLLGDPYLAVENRGDASQGELKSGDVVENTRVSVDFDEVLSFLDEEGRRHVKSLIRTVADGITRPGNGERLSGTLGGVARTVHELHLLTKSVRGQERQIADLVSSSSTVLTTLGNREQAIRTIVGAGRSTLDALNANTRSLEQGLDELPRLLASGRASLAQLRPLLSEARPVFAKLRAVSPPLAAALNPKATHSLNKSVDSLIEIIHGLAPLNRDATPVLRNLKVLLDELVPVVREGAKGGRILVPALDYLTPRSKALATGYALIAAALSKRDSKGHYLRAGFGISADEMVDGTQGKENYNPYPGAGDAADPKPFSGSYPRIVPCTVPSRKTPKEPCK